ncbi:hypothetical protein K1719_038517 [Acacia pycnantha]|nr:hypothetical protein K1719_038517 [Acacia pycnantha]
MEFQSPYPDQVLENVLYFFTVCCDCNATSLVCKSWCRAKTPIRSEFYIGNFYVVSPRHATSHFTWVHSVAMKGKSRFTDFNLMPLNLGALFLSWVTAMAKTYPWLENFYLKHITVVDEDLEGD